MRKNNKYVSSLNTIQEHHRATDILKLTCIKVPSNLLYSLGLTELVYYGDDSTSVSYILSPKPNSSTLRGFIKYWSADPVAKLRTPAEKVDCLLTSNSFTPIFINKKALPPEKQNLFDSVVASSYYGGKAAELTLFILNKTLPQIKPEQFSWEHYRTYYINRAVQYMKQVLTP